MGGTIKVGTVISDGKGHYKQWSGSGWSDIAPPAVGSPTGGRKMSVAEQKMLDEQRQGAQSALEAKVRTQEIAPALRRLKGGPMRGMFLDAAIPSSKGGFLDALGGMVIGGPARLLGAISPQEVADYQQVDRAATLSTRQSETGEKGVQTEGDAARALLAAVTPSNINPDAVTRSILGKADRQISRADFYTKWANKYGLSGLDENGRSVERAFNDVYTATHKPKRGTPTIRRIK
ncbi:MAG: hypothetical protein E6Q97_30610 [Desulfurellales bacterium]|nr:MAG: hypothetical protein E6Q97_30610 [Desulfurellales bacterium]